MSEKKYHHQSLEHARGTQEVHDHKSEKLDELVQERRDVRHEHAEKIDELRQEINAKATSRDEALIEQQEQEPETHTLGINRELKDMAYQRTLTRVRKDLSTSERTFSKVVHNPTIEAVSNATSKTVARPSGLLAGGIFAFLGSTVFLWIAKHNGYEYNFLLFALFFAGGFAVGLVIELLLRILRHRRV